MFCPIYTIGVRKKADPTFALNLQNPGSFSQMQIHAYLKTVAFRRDINEVQKAAAGKGMGGIPTARIASEANREYIFSTSFQPENHKNEIDL